MSVQIRELVRRGADDGSWTSDRVAQQTFLRVPQQRSGHVETIRATTALPPLAIAHRAAAMLPILLGLAVLAYGVALFIARYVFLGAVTAPMWALGRLAIPEGKPVILLCDPQAMAPRIHGAAKLSLAAALSGVDRSRALERAMEDIGRGEHADGPILVTDLDTGAPGPRELADRAQLLHSLVSARTWAVLVLSKQPFPELAAESRVTASRLAKPLPLERRYRQSGGARSDRPGLARAPRRGGRPTHAVGDLRRRRLVATPDGAGSPGVNGNRLRGRAWAST